MMGWRGQQVSHRVSLLLTLFYTPCETPPSPLLQGTILVKHIFLDAINRCNPDIRFQKFSRWEIRRQKRTPFLVLNENWSRNASVKLLTPSLFHTPALTDRKKISPKEEHCQRTKGERLLFQLHMNMIEGIVFKVRGVGFWTFSFFF